MSLEPEAESFGITEEYHLRQAHGVPTSALTSTGSAFSPCQITGFFRIHDSAENPLRIGSTGAGINLGLGVTTSVRVRQTSRSRSKILFNSKPLPNPVVSLTVLRDHLAVSSRKMLFTISHESVLPMGCGYGTSGAGALSLSLALNEVLGSNLTKIEAAQIAHKAEVENKTGLGTVTSAFFGGLVLRTRPGAPGYAEITKVNPPASLRIVSGSFGPISTKDVLTSTPLRERINRCAKGLIALQLRNLETSTFLKLSQRFSKCLGMISPRLLQARSMMEERRMISGMMMLGESLFTIVGMDHVPEASAALRKAGLTPVVSRIAKRGAQVL